MHRVRQSLPHFREFGWEPTVVAVEPEQVEGFLDPLLMQTIPDDVRVEHVGALDYHWTRLVGLGSVALRSLPFYLNAGNRLLQNQQFDLVYFSTTAFPVLLLGPIWQRRFDVPFVVDMQDPWYSEYYLHRPKSERPPKYWFAHRLNRFLEPRVLPRASAIIAVTSAYITLLQDRYPDLKEVPAVELPFGASSADMEVARTLPQTSVGDRADILLGTYTGVCNSAMVPTLEIIMRALKRGLAERPELFSRVRLRFIGTSYATPDRAEPVVLPIASRFGVMDRVQEETSRVPYFEALRMQSESDFLLLPGTIDGAYTASKLYPYIMSERPILALFSKHSSVIDVLSETKAGTVVSFDPDRIDSDVERQFLRRWIHLLEQLPFSPETNWSAFERYTSREMTRRQVDVFNSVVQG